MKKLLILMLMGTTLINAENYIFKIEKNIGIVTNKIADSNGFYNDGTHKDTGTLYNPEGYNKDGYNEEGYDKEDYDQEGLSKTKECESGYPYYPRSGILTSNLSISSPQTLSFYWRGTFLGTSHSQVYVGELTVSNYFYYQEGNGYLDGSTRYSFGICRKQKK